MRTIFFLIIVALVFPLFAQIDLPPESRDYKLFMGNQTIGYYSYTLKPVPGGWDLNAETFMAITAGGKPARLRMKTSWQLDSRMHPENYRIEIFSDDELRQEIEVQVSGGKAKISENGSTRSIDLPARLFTAELNVIDGWLLLPRMFDLERDSSFSLSMFVPQLGNVIEAGIFPGQFEGTAGAPSRKFSVKAPGVEIEFYAQIDSRTLTYWSATNQGIVARIAPNLDKNEIEQTAVGADIFGNIMRQENILADIDVDIPLNIIRLKADIDIRLSTDTEKYLEPAGQKFAGEIVGTSIKGGIVIEAKGFDGKRALSYPIGPTNIPIEGYVDAEPKIESADSTIIAFASSIATESENIWQVAKAINRFVTENIDIDTEERSASRTLTLSKGNSLSHARLCVALLRALGIPARVVGGVILDQGFWLRHHWVEVWVSPKDKWIPIDPTSGEDMSFSASHITLWLGEGQISPSRTNSIVVIDYQLHE